MGWFTPKKNAEFRPVPGEQLFVGEASYQPALLQLLAGRGHTPASVKEARKGFEEHFEARLVPEANNAYDANAVAVHINGAVVAYLSRANALAYRKAIGVNVGEVSVKVWVSGKAKGIVSVWPA